MPTARRRRCRPWTTLVVAVILAMGAAACSDDGDGDRRAQDDRRLDVPGPSEVTTPAESVPTPPEGGAVATVRWSEGRADSTAELTDEPSRCRVQEGPRGWSLVVEVGPDQPGTDRASDALRLQVGPLARLDGPGVDPAGPLLADVERLEVVVAGAGLPSDPEAEGVLASVSADLSSLQMPLSDGSLEVTCGT